MNSIVRRNVPESLSVEEVRKATVNDPILLEALDIVENRNGESRYKSKIKDHISWFDTSRSLPIELSLEDHELL